MKKIININLSGRVIPIEDSAYESLQKYIESLRQFFAKEDGRDEIINDIESRIAELMNDKIKRGAAAITDFDINEIIASMGRVEDFEQIESETSAFEASGSQSSSSESNQTFTNTGRRRRGRLNRNSTDKILGGVGAGIANYLDVDPSVIRILLILFGFTGTGIVLYVILWIALPARDLNNFVGKRLYRNPEDKVISGVAGGIAAYAHMPAWIVRAILAAPLLINIVFGTFNRIFFDWDRDVFPNLFVVPFTGTFILAYIILWIVLPEAKSPFEQMEMRGEKVDVNRIRQNVQDELNSFRSKARAWGEEVRSSSQQFSAKAAEFGNTRGRAFASEVSDSARPVARGLVHIIGVLFKAFIIFIIVCVALSVFAALMVVIFGGVAWWPINNFLWTSGLQKSLFWGTVLFFLTVPVVGLVTWMIRRLVKVRTKRNSHLGWIFGGLWVLGWICAVCFGASVMKDLRKYERATSEVNVNQGINKLMVAVNEPEIRFNGDTWWFQADNTGWDLDDTSMKYNNVKLQVLRSKDSSYHVIVHRYSAGRNVGDAQRRASEIVFSASTIDSTLNLGSGLGIRSSSKFRGQGVVVEIQVPAGKKIRFDESVRHAFNPWIIRTSDRDFSWRWSGRRRYQSSWDDGDYFEWKPDVDYVMTSDEKLIEMDKVVVNGKGVYEKAKTEDANNLRNSIQDREEELRRDRERLEELERSRDNDSTRTGLIRQHKQSDEPVLIMNILSPIII